MADYNRREFLKILGAGTISAFLPFRSGKGKGEDLVKMRVTYPPAFSSLPLKFGVKKGIFEKFGLDLKIENATGKKEALEPLVKGNNHCCITDISRAVLFFSKIGKNIAITSTAFEPSTESRYLGLLLNGEYEDIISFTSFAEKLKSSEKYSIQLTKGSDVHCLTDSLFALENIDTNENSFYTNRSSLMETIRYLWTGRIFSTALAEPLLTLSLSVPYFTQPILISDYSNVESLPTVFVFRKGVIREEEEMVNRFYRGWVESVKETNKLSKEKLFSLALTIAENLPGFKGKMEQISLPPDFEESFDKPQFSLPNTLKGEDYDRVAKWAQNKGYVDDIPKYDSIVDKKSITSFEEAND